MEVFIRAKRVTDPFDDKAKARLRGDDLHRMTGYASSSSGSEHDCPPCLSGLVHAFLESTDPADPAADHGGSSDHGDDSDEDAAGDRSGVLAAEMVRDLLNPPADDRFRIRLLSDVSDAAEVFDCLRSNGSAYRRAVMARLRASGYNAGICKARWKASGGLAAGSHEYIDVVAEAQRYIVDVDFAEEFEIARPTEEYGRLTAALPRVAVARVEVVRQVVRTVAEAVRRSLRNRGLHQPPWRKGRYMLAKWLGPYRRTVNTLPASAGSAVSSGAEIKCRSVGFQAPPGVLVVPHAARTR